MKTAQFPSDEWIGLVGEQAQRLLSEKAPASQVKFSMIERYTGVPEPRPDCLTHGYRLEFNGPVATIKGGVTSDETADVQVVADHDLVVALLRVKSGPEMSRMMQRATEAGTISFCGTSDGAPFDMMLLHDAMVDCTA